MSRHGTAYEYRKRGKILHPGRMTEGHLSVALGKANSHCVHELVLLAFVGPCPPGHECRHLDGDEANNRLFNLRWDTRGNNGRDKKWHRVCSRYKLRPEDIIAIKALLGTISGRKLGIIFGVTESNISCIRTGKIHIDV
ncbi:HNH endonuclease signature motif containing protein [Nitratireductor soli]|uniref:HNH endonuclease signature motif containing protein n=1 Tax=Nitratireductor soli TaxID=1670619 RepID=UPI0009E25806|nr:HNH endonuclease signature motif containing protein [Nitratireductor soli]